MRPDTRETIARLESFTWCVNYGRAVDPREDWVAASNAAEARASALSDDWRGVRLMVSNRMHRDVGAVDHGRFTKWNAVVMEVQAAVAPLVEKVTAIWCGGRVPSEEQRISVAWDIEGICLEAEFSDLVSPLLFLPRVLECYQSGHMPCGWRGATVDERWAGASHDPLPSGKLLVF